MPLVSVLMPAYNAAATIEEAITSVQAQSFADWELLVIDDHSTDSTRHTVETLARDDRRIHMLENTRLAGAAAARNTGLDAATGRYIAFLDADDMWLADKLDLQLQLMRETGTPLTYGGFLTRRAGRPDKEIRVPGTVTYDSLLRGNVIGCLTAMYDTKACGKVAMPEIARRHDFALWLALLKAQGPASGVTQPVAIHRLGRSTLSSNKLRATYDTWRMYRDVLGLSPGTSLAHLSRHLLQRILR